MANLPSTKAAMPGAMRAAKRIAAQCTLKDTNWAAKIIERETGCKEMLEALEVLNDCHYVGPGLCPACHKIAQAAIAKGRGL